MTTTAADILAAVREEIESHQAGTAFMEWSDAESGRRYAAVVNSLAVWQSGPREMTVTVADTRDGRIWGGVTSYVLDAAANFDDVFATAEIHAADTSARLTW